MEEQLVALVESPAAPVLAFLLGALLGSFAGVCIARIPIRMSIVKPPSHCFACGKPLRWTDNLPIVSYLVLRGRCRNCGTRYSPRTLLVELITGVLVCAVFIVCRDGLALDWPLSWRMARFGVYTVFCLVLVVITFIDLDTKLIPDRITYPAIPLFWLAGVLVERRGWLTPTLGVLVGYGIVRGISDAYYFITKREGLGYGDGKLLAVVGGLLGWKAVLFSLFGGALLGTMTVALALIFGRVKRGGTEAGVLRLEVPFGPFLAAAAVVFLFLQEGIDVAIRAYLFPFS